jgi:hypothetical protein
VPPATLIAWCNTNPQNRYLIAASVGSLFKKDNNGAPLQWTTLAPFLLQGAPDPTALLPLFIKRLYPNGWGGSWATEMEGRFRLLEHLDVSTNAELRAAKSEALARMRTQIDESRQREAEEDRQRSARFE